MPNKIFTIRKNVMDDHGDVCMTKCIFAIMEIVPRLDVLFLAMSEYIIN